MNVKILAIFVTAIVATIGVRSSYATSNTETIEKTRQKIKEIQDRIDDLENNKDVLQSKIQAKKDKLRAEQAMIKVDGKNKWITLIQNASLHKESSE